MKCTMTVDASGVVTFPDSFAGVPLAGRRLDELLNSGWAPDGGLEGLGDGRAMIILDTPVDRTIRRGPTPTAGKFRGRSLGGIPFGGGLRWINDFR